jgi:hypothetical protein
MHMYVVHSIPNAAYNYDKAAMVLETANISECSISANFNFIMKLCKHKVLNSHYTLIFNKIFLIYISCNCFGGM